MSVSIEPVKYPLQSHEQRAIHNRPPKKEFLRYQMKRINWLKKKVWLGTFQVEITATVPSIFIPFNLRLRCRKHNWNTKMLAHSFRFANWTVVTLFFTSYSGFFSIYYFFIDFFLLACLDMVVFFRHLIVTYSSEEKRQKFR